MKAEEYFRQTIENNYDKIYRICARYFGNPEDARDACQDVLMKIWLNLGKFRGEADISTWIFRITVNVCLSSIKAAKRTKAKQANEPVSLLAEQPEEEHGEVHQEELKLQFFRKFCQQLPEGDKVLVSLYLEELDTVEMASVTGLSESNVRTRIHRIKKQIRKQWENNYGTR